MLIIGGGFMPLTDGRYEITGINEEREVQDWNSYEISVSKNGMALPLSAVTAAAFGGDEITLTTNESGKALPSPEEIRPYLISVEWLIKDRDSSIKSLTNLYGINLTLLFITDKTVAPVKKISSASFVGQKRHCHGHKTIHYFNCSKLN